VIQHPTIELRLVAKDLATVFGARRHEAAFA
jgi:hypothetical protein